jgi:hypothetical protein
LGDEGVLGVVVVGDGGAGSRVPDGRRVWLVSGGRDRSILAVVVVVVVVDEDDKDTCDGARRVVADERVVTDDFARVCPWHRPLPESGAVPAPAVDATRGREVGTPDDVVGLVMADGAARTEAVDGWRVDAVRVKRPGAADGGASGPGLSCWP